MGCCTSIDMLEKEQLDAYLTRREIRLAQKSWKTMKKNLPDLGLLAFKKFFEMQSDMKSLFGKLMIRDENGELEIDEEELQNHATMVMEALGTAVESLEDTSFLTAILMRMGENHANYHVEAEMIPLLWPAINLALRDKLDNQFTEEVETAWRHVFEYIARHFAQGIVLAQKKKP